ncbi:MAG: tetratricopeptide repeat protein [Nitrospirae bacterium]|nr:MAG: tetratricopeptide repeat protein [Nitrospirota bacterium]
MPKAIKKRISKKETGGEDISGTVTGLRERIKERQKTLIYATVAAMTVIISAVTFFVYTGANATKASELEAEGLKTLYSLSRGAEVPVDQYRRALDFFKKSYDAKKSNSALLHMANCNYALGNYDAAIKNLLELNGSASDTGMLSLSYYKLASAYAKKGDTENALKSYGNLTSIKGAGLQELALIESAKLLEAAGKTEEAQKKYKELAEKFPKSLAQDNVSETNKVKEEKR